MTQADIAIVLPPRERFAAEGSGAVSLLVHRLMRVPSRYRRVVIGAQTEGAYDDVPFRAAPAVWRPSTSWAYAVGVDRVLGEPALIEVHNRADLAWRIARARPNAKVTLMLHNDPQRMRGLRTPHERALAAERFAGIACVSDYLAARFADGVKCQPTVLANCIDLAAVPASPATRQKLILFAGRVVADKGADGFVAACASALPELPGWRAEMIGADRFAVDSPVTPFVAQLKPAAEQAGVALLGYRTHAQVMRAMARAAIVVVPSRWQEPFGLTALEAMAGGAAVICSGRGGLAEVVGDVALPCDPDDPAGIAAAIRRLAWDEAECDARGQAGQARARLFDVKVAAAALETYRATLLGR